MTQGETLHWADIIYTIQALLKSIFLKWLSYKASEASLKGVHLKRKRHAFCGKTRQASGTSSVQRIWHSGSFSVVDWPDEIRRVLIHCSEQNLIQQCWNL